VSIPCILALQKESLIRLTLANLFSNSDGELVAIDSEAERLDELIGEVKQYKAKVILLENTNPFTEETSLTQLLTLPSNLLVIVIQEDNNWLQIYSKEKKLLTSTMDLLEVIHTVRDYPSQPTQKQEGLCSN
jgi:DNA-binding NarL/FixJ family response regulator